MGNSELEYIKALGVRMKLGQTEYPAIMKVGMNKTGSGNFCYISFLMCLLDGLSRDIFGCYPQSTPFILTGSLYP